MNIEYIHKDTKTDEPLQQELQNYFQVINGTALYYENYVKQLQQEIERLNNIINKLEEYLFNDLQEYGGGGYVQEIYNKLKELKGNK